MMPLTIHRYGSSNARTVVLMHGLTEAGTTWPDLVGHWGDNWHVLAPDLRGHGQSPRFTEDELATAPEVLLADVVTVVDVQPEPVALVGHSLGGLLALRAAVARPDRVWALVLEDPARPTGGRTPDPGFVAENEDFLDAMADQAGQVARMLRDSSWSRAEIEAWAACKPLVDRAYLRRGLYLGDGAWEELFDALRVPTLRRRTRRWRPGRRRCTTTWSGPWWCPVPATACAATSPPGTSGPSTRSSPRWRGHSRPGTRRHLTKESDHSRGVWISTGA
jgi:pimeloyl-ACP methyl ester carboxylesterase